MEINYSDLTVDELREANDIIREIKIFFMEESGREFITYINNHRRCFSEFIFTVLRNYYLHLSTEINYDTIYYDVRLQIKFLCPPEAKGEELRW